MSTKQISEIARRLNEAGVPPEFDPDHSRLLIRAWRTLAKGQPISSAQVDQMVAGLAISTDEAHRFLREISERNSADSIVGLFGLSLNHKWRHRFGLEGGSLRTWCAWDALFLPPILNETVIIESDAPETGQTVRLEVSPDRVEEQSPAGAVVTMVSLDASKHDADSVDAIWSNFCHQVYFFPSRTEADQWATSRDNINVLTVDEAFELGRQAFSKLLCYARSEP